jgi:hypothetical protein
MQDRILEFVAALRAAGVRISVAESADALRAAAVGGIVERELFRAALQASLVKDAADLPRFRQLFPLYFGAGGVALAQPDAAALSEFDRTFLQRMLAEVLSGADSPGLAQLFAAAVSGVPLAQGHLNQLIAVTAPLGMSHPFFQPWMARRTLRELGFEQLETLLRELLDLLGGGGMAAEQLAEIEATVRANLDSLAAQLGQLVGVGMMQRAARERPSRRPLDELLERPFEVLKSDEREAMREAVQKLAARLRSRLALRQRRGKRGPLDAKATIRANMQLGGVPLSLRHRRRHRKPKLVVLCDLSNSMRSLAGFALQFVYALHDQIGRVRAFAFIDELSDISGDFSDARPHSAIARILGRVQADYAHTDLGHALATFTRDHMHSVDGRTTVLIIGDGRNNYADPNLLALALIKSRARHLVWFCPESRRAWPHGDSDMARYEPLCDAVHHVANLRQLAEAVEGLFEGS